MKPRWLLLLPLLSFVAFFRPLLNVGHRFELDWKYFNALSLLTRSNVWSYHVFPLHNPWSCGGLDLILNPQSRVLSPMAILDLLFAPQAANLASLIVYGAIGLLGTYALLRRIRISPAAAGVGSFLFVNCGWFGLHFTEGHITFGSMQLLPLVLYLFLNLAWARGYAFFFFFLMAEFLLDGGAYMFAYTALMLIGAIVLRIPPVHFRPLLRTLRRDTAYFALVVAMFLCLALAKLAPVLQVIQHRTPVTELTVMPLSLLGYSLFYPFQQTRLPVIGNMPYWFHEFGCYLGVLGTLLIAWGFTRKSFPRANWKYLLLAFFFFWVGSGAGGSLNPWVLFQKLPILNNVHVQSRVFILGYLFFVILLAQALERLRSRRWIFAAACCLLVAESLIVRHFTMSALSHDYGPALRADELIRSQTITRTVQSGNYPEHYLAGDAGTSQCYEPSFQGMHVPDQSSALYRGEAYLLEGSGTVSIRSYTPGRIRVAYRVDSPAWIGLNTHSLDGWKISEGPGTIAPQPWGLVGVRVPAGQGETVLSYSPTYLANSLALLLTGLALAGIALAMAIRRRSGHKHGGFNYQAIPEGYYDRIMVTGGPIRRCWHLQKFERVIDYLPNRPGQSILDIGCFAGTFLSMLKPEQFSSQLGVDILEKQIGYAQAKFGTEYRKFQYLPSIRDIQGIRGSFDCVTLIEVIEHLTEDQVREMIHQIVGHLKKGGKLVISTPNYASSWPLLEGILNHLSDVSYEEQHLTKFDYFNAYRKLCRIAPEAAAELELDFKTTTHFVTPFLAAISLPWACRMARAVPHQSWHFPFGNLILMVFTKK